MEEVVCAHFSLSLRWLGPLQLLEHPRVEAPAFLQLLRMGMNMRNKKEHVASKENVTCSPLQRVLVGVLSGFFGRKMHQPSFGARVMSRIGHKLYPGPPVERLE